MIGALPRWRNLKVGTMQTRNETGEIVGPARLLEMLEWRFGVFESLAYASLTLAQRVDLDICPPMDKETAWAVLEFNKDLRQALDETEKWAAIHFGSQGRGTQHRDAD